MGLRWQNIFSEIKAPDAEKEVFDNYMPVNLGDVNLKLLLLFVRHYAEHAIRVAGVILPGVDREKTKVEIVIDKPFLHTQ